MEKPLTYIMAIAIEEEEKAKKLLIGAIKIDLHGGMVSWFADEIKLECEHAEHLHMKGGSADVRCAWAELIHRHPHPQKEEFAEWFAGEIDGTVLISTEDEVEGRFIASAGCRGKFPIISLAVLFERAFVPQNVSLERYVSDLCIPGEKRIRHGTQTFLKAKLRALAALKAMRMARVVG